MNEVEKLFGRSETAAGFAREYLRHTAALLEAVNEDQLDAMIEALLAARNRGGAIWLLGNGGSAATANHFANDLVVGVRARPPFRAVSLCANTSVLTAIGNDFGYDEVFARQLSGRVRTEDVVVAISASGESANVIRSFEVAASVGATTVAVTGFEGGRTRDLADVSVHVPTNVGEYGPVEAVHTVLLHIVSNYLMLRCERA